jgi:hypothetical protein
MLYIILLKVGRLVFDV